ncbi:MAG: hypothetical protein CM15mV144_200 [Caudoviricetes sp.]|nr:MAG: hypothetical protein CM15mV144_200 [Caudoviricetes sp.]
MRETRETPGLILLVIFLINRTSSGFNNDGTIIGNSSGSYMYMERSTGTVNLFFYLHRRNGDGAVNNFYESNSAEGYIQVSGSNFFISWFLAPGHDSSGSGISSKYTCGTVLSILTRNINKITQKIKSI